jgi:glycosyltransferase involved in cell wall biosynthesis
VRVAMLALSRVPSRKANAIRVLKMSQAVQRLGHETCLWLPGPSPGLSEIDIAAQYGLNEPIPIRWVPRSSWLRGYDYSWFGVLAARKWRADLVFAWPLQAAAFASLLGLPTLLELHERPAGRSAAYLLRRFLRGRGARRLVVITRHLKRLLENDFRGTLGDVPLLVEPMAADTRLYQGLPSPEEAKRKLGLEQRFTVSYTGHLYPGRGMEVMVELAHRLPEVRFLWAGGEASDVETWRGKVAQRGLGNILLMGFLPQPELPMIHAASDALLMPYQRSVETSSGSNTMAYASPLKLFEYLAAGRPILSSDLPVLREVLDESNSLLLPPEDVGAWEGALRWVMENPGAASELGHSAKRMAEQHTWEARAERILEGLG